MSSPLLYTGRKYASITYSAGWHVVKDSDLDSIFATQQVLFPSILTKSTSYF